MNEKILADAAAFARLFLWNGPPPEKVFSEWITSHGLRSATDLVHLLRITGGGVVFETETILAPGAEADGVNATHGEAGLPPELWLFHSGMTLSAFHRAKQFYIELSPSYAVLSEFALLDEWYLFTLRNEYGERYGLPKG